MGTGTAVATGDIITAAKMNLKLETLVDADITHSSGDWTVGVDGAGQDIIYYTDTSGRVITWDASDGQLEFDDNVLLAFGDDDDVTIEWDASKLEILPATDDTGAINIGNGTKDIDLKWFGGTTAKYVLLDVGNTKLTLEDVDLYLGDNDMLVFGDGADVTMYWDAAKLTIVPAAEFILSMASYHFYIQTATDTKNIRLNSRDYTATSGDCTAVQSKPNMTGDGTAGVNAFESMPRFADGIGGSKIVGYMSNPILKGTTGDLTGPMRCYEGKLESDSGSTRTLAEAYVLHAMNALHGTVTAGPYVIKVDAAGGNVEWVSLMKLIDNGGPIADLATGVTGSPTGVFKITIGSTVGYVPMYVGYTAA